MNSSELVDFEWLARDFIDEHAPDYRFEWFNMTRTVGMCLYGPRVIQISRPIAKLNSHADVWLTVQHEVAHALAGRAAGHGADWRRICLALGGDGKRLNTRVTVPARLEAVCKAGHRFTRMRKPRRGYTYYCSKCPSHVAKADPLVYLAV